MIKSWRMRWAGHVRQMGGGGGIKIPTQFRNNSAEQDMFDKELKKCNYLVNLSKDERNLFFYM
jgi:hypothetical protein